MDKKVPHMGCNELLQLLQRRQSESEGPPTDVVSTSDGSIILHMRTCTHCRHGLARLSDTVSDDSSVSALTCDQCLALLPTYYEATHPDHPLVDMLERTAREVVHHLAGCNMCSEAYEELVALAALEERDDFAF